MGVINVPAHPISKGNFLVFLWGMPVATATKVKIPKRIAGTTKSKTGTNSRAQISHTGMMEFENLVLTSVQAYEHTDAAMFAVMTGQHILPPIPPLVVTVVMQDNAGLPRKTWTCVGCKFKSAEPEEMEGGSEDPATYVVEFEVEDMIESPKV